MMQHYVSTKRRVSASLATTSDRSVILMYRVGDFFESFFEDARILSNVCEIALTSKDAGKALGTRIPMAGVPHFCIDEKIKILLAHDITVAVVDQVQTAAQTPSGKLVERAVTRLITPGTACDDTLIESKMSSFLASIVVKPHTSAQLTSDNSQYDFGFAYADVSTGEFKATDGSGHDVLRRLLVTTNPAEVLLVLPSSHEHLRDQIIHHINSADVGLVSMQDFISAEAAEQAVTSFHNVDSVESLGVRGRHLCIESAAVLLHFLKQTLAVDGQQSGAITLDRLTTFSISDVMLLDSSCLKNLEVVETVRDGIKERSLQWAVDRTVTAMGARCLRSWLLSPSMNLDVISERHQIIDALVQNGGQVRMHIQSDLKDIADLERLGGRVCSGRVTPRELRWLCESILKLPHIISKVGECIESNAIAHSEAHSTPKHVDIVDQNLLDIAQKTTHALRNPAPSVLVSELMVNGGGLAKESFNMSSLAIFCPEFNSRLDDLRQAIDEPDSWISVLEEQERLRSSIDTLRIKHIKNTGFVLRIPRSAGERKMNDDPLFFAKLGYDRVQSTKAELRFRFDQLKDHERSYNRAFGEILLLELRLFNELREEVASFVPYLRSLAKQIAGIDVLAGFAEVAQEKNYVRPNVLPASARTMELKDARHAVVEQTMPIGNTFVPNSYNLGAGAERSHSAAPDMMILCGPNAAGKSCALRSIGLISILAQVGSFVPARSATLSLCDRIFTRVGAVDDLARGQSTFQVEMAETACILSHVTPSSLVLLDEIGRGTSTVDGISIAWSVAEYLAQRSASESSPPRAVFVTHYHELNHLASLFQNVKSFHLHVERKQDHNKEHNASEVPQWITTYKVVPGPSYESHGLAIAERAGFPDGVIARAREINALLQAPSQAFGSELQNVLSDVGSEDLSNIGQCDSDRKGKAGEETTGRMKDSQFQLAFKEGYQSALAEVRTEFERMMKGITPH